MNEIKIEPRELLCAVCGAGPTTLVLYKKSYCPTCAGNIIESVIGYLHLPPYVISKLL